MKKNIVILAVFTAMGLYAGETKVEKLHDHYSAEANKTDNSMAKEMSKGLDENASKPTQRMQNLNEAVERLVSGKATEADKELIKNEDEPFIKKLQESTVYPFSVDINDPIYHTLATFYASLTSAASTTVDLYMLKHCTNSLSKMTLEEIKEAGATREWGLLFSIKSSSFNSSEDTYRKFVHATRAFNCVDDSGALKKYLQKDNEYEGTFVAGLLKEDMGDKPVFISYKNEVGNECVVIGHTTVTIPSVIERVEIELEKETCKSGEAFIVNGYAAKTDENLFFSNILPGDKVKIFKTK